MKINTELKEKHILHEFFRKSFCIEAITSLYIKVSYLISSRFQGISSRQLLYFENFMSSFCSSSDLCWSAVVERYQSCSYGNRSTPWICCQTVYKFWWSFIFLYLIYLYIYLRSREKNRHRDHTAKLAQTTKAHNNGGWRRLRQAGILESHLGLRRGQ